MLVKIKKVFIKTFGCAQNMADSERVKASYWEKGWQIVDSWKEADEIVINTCIVRQSAENRAWGLIDKINNYELRITNYKPRVIVTGCVVGAYGKKDIKGVDEWVPIKKYLVWEPIRDKKGAALISISSGCDNYCSYCIVPKARGREISRDMSEILAEVDQAIVSGFKEVVLIGQNVNSYQPSFPKLLEEAAKKELNKISFVSSNPWDFSDELIEVIAKNKNIDRLIHLPFQSGNNEILKKMNRAYTKEQYLNLVESIKLKVKNVRFSTDILIGFPGETAEMFEDTVDVCRRVGFEIAYLNKYSPRTGTVSAKLYQDDVPMTEKKRRWVVLEKLVNMKS
jgi:tRNA-2-methylthio-N6-dimethylallyladenosine synthase